MSARRLGCRINIDNAHRGRKKEQELKSEVLDIAVIGGGPAGISACLELSKNPKLKIALFESEAELGGVPRSCHLFFGMRDMGRLYTGPRYATRLRTLLERTSVDAYTNATVLGIATEHDADFHAVTVSSSQGLLTYRCRFVLLATGCFEKSREARRIPGSRPAGVYTTGALQQIVNLNHQIPGQRAVIIGSEHVAFSCAMTLHRARVSIVGLIEEDKDISTYRLPARAISTFF